MNDTQPGAGPVDVTSWIGGYPFRDVPHPDPEVLVRVLEREGFSGAWVGHLPGTFQRDPWASNTNLYRALAAYRDVLQPAPIIRPDWPRWEAALRQALDEGAPALRACPMQWGMGADNPALNELALACGEAGVALHLTVRFEDVRQRSTLDVSPDLGAGVLRSLARLKGSRCRIVVAGAGRELIEEVHWGLTAEEQKRVWYDWHWVWGPPEDHFSHLLGTIGPERFVWSSWWPLRLSQHSRALVDLLPNEQKDFALQLSDGRSVLAPL